MLSKEDLSDDFDFPAYSSDSSNNGIIGFTNNPEFICDDITPVYITFGDHTRTVNIAKKSFSVLDNVKVLKPFTFNEKYLLFIISSWKKQIPNLGYARHWKVAKDCKIQLPLKENALAFSNPCDNIKNIDFDFMESFIRELEEEHICELEEERIRELNAYLLATGLKDYTLTPEEENALEAFKTVQWGEFNLENLYGKSTRGKRLKSEDRIKGDLPFVTAGEADTGISAYISNDVETFSKNTTTIDMFGSAKYRNYNYGADDHVAVVHTEDLPKHSSIFVTSAIHKSSHTGKFDYSNNFYASDADELNIQLPTKDGKPDYATMETFIKAVEKLVIKDVVLYADKKIKATKEVVSENSLKDYPETNPNFGLSNVAQSR